MAQRMDEQQQKAFAEAVERKKQAARAASEQTGQNPRGSEVTGSKDELNDPSTSADQPTPHHKSSRHGQVTAENWNQ
jgi:hypothetical protein